MGLLVAPLLAGDEVRARRCEPNNAIDPDATDIVSVTFLGVQGFLIRRGDDAILTAPLFSNPGILAISGAFGSVTANEDRIDRILSGRYGDLEPYWKQVDGILVGHSHYDHLMDVPYLFSEYIGGATIYGGRTAESLLATFPEIPAHAVVVVNEVAGSHEHPGDWLEVPGTRSSDGRWVRLMAICSEHSPQMFGYNLWQGRLAEPPERQPRTAPEWAQGITYAFLIDFMEEEGIVFRIYYADSPTGRPYGFLPAPLAGSVDLIILNAGGSTDVPHYPIAILDNTLADAAIVGHWEGFFDSQLEPLHELPGAEAVVGVLKDRGLQWDCLPEPGAVFELPVVQ